MDMEDHHHPPHHYSVSDLRHLINPPPRSTPTHFPSNPPQPPTSDLFHPHRNLTPHHYDMIMFGRHVSDVMPRTSLHDFASDSPPSAAAPPPTNNITTVATPATTSSAFTPPLSALDADTPGCLPGDASTGRWPRQETLTLLEIRSRLDPKFKEANQKGPLWDEVSRIMSEEYGYQRSGKKCREKFENLYKYYKKTKEGKARRQDGKHYRFFRQLEALYGGNNNSTSLPESNYGNNTVLGFQTSSQTNHQDMMFQSHNNNGKTCDSLSLTNSTDFATSSSDNDSTDKMRKRGGSGGGGSRWKAKIKEFIDSQMKKLIEKQEAWMDRLVKTLELKEKERVLREEEWRRQEAARLEMEHKFRAKERGWIEARDAALMDALQKLTGREVNMGNNNNEIHRESSRNEEGSEIILNAKEGGGVKKRKEDSRSCFYFDQSTSLYNHQGTTTTRTPYCDINGVNDQRHHHENERLQGNDGSSPSNSNAVAAADVNCFPFFLNNEGSENLWENYGLKISKGNQNQ